MLYVQGAVCHGGPNADDPGRPGNGVTTYTLRLFLQPYLPRRASIYWEFLERIPVMSCVLYFTKSDQVSTMLYCNKT